jgi:hypothetical protein
MMALSTNEDLLRHPILLGAILIVVTLALTWLTTFVPQIVPRHQLDPNAVIVDSDYIGLEGIPRPFIIHDPRNQQPPLFSRTELVFNFVVDFFCAFMLVLAFIFLTEGVPYLARRLKGPSRLIAR